MEQPTVRKTYKYKLQPTPTQEQTLAFVVRRCRELYNAALHERRGAWQKCRVSINAAHQSAELPAIKEVRPEYHDVHSQVLQDALTRLDRAFVRHSSVGCRLARRLATLDFKERAATTASPTSRWAMGLHSQMGS